MLSRFHPIPERYGRQTGDKNCAPSIVLLKLTTDIHEASRGLSATAELLVSLILTRLGTRGLGICAKTQQIFTI